MRFYQDLDDTELTQHFNKGEEGAFAEIYRRNWLTLYQLALKYSSSPEESEEMVQTLFEKLWRKRGSITINHLGAFLAISLRNLFLDNLKAAETQKKLKSGYGGFVIDRFENNELEFKELTNVIENILQELPSKTNTVFRLSRFEGKSVKEIAAIIGLTEKAVEYHITKAIKAVRLKLKAAVLFFLFF